MYKCQNMVNLDDPLEQVRLPKYQIYTPIDVITKGLCFDKRSVKENIQNTDSD